MQIDTSKFLIFFAEKSILILDLQKKKFQNCLVLYNFTGVNTE